MAEKITVIGYHGTDNNNHQSVIEEGFRLSLGDKEWLGSGVYFFTEDYIPPEPISNAVEWAVAQAWDTKLKSFKYNRYCIISAKVSCDSESFLDLNTRDGMETFCYFRNKFVENIFKAGKRLKNKEAIKDGHVINLARELYGIKIDVVKGNFYIKFTVERKHNINFRIPNCTILSVFNTNCIEKDSLNVVKVGEIKN